MKKLTVPLLFLLFSCNSLSSHIEQHVDNKVEASKQEMKDEVQNIRQGFITSYKNKSNKLVDSLDKAMLQELYHSVIHADTYLDSLKGEMDKMDEMDVTNIELVKTTFLYKGVGDSIFNKLKTSINAAQNAAGTERQKAVIQAANDSLFNVPADKWKEQFFGLTNPLGASMIIYGFQTELYRIGMEALKNN